MKTKYQLSSLKLWLLIPLAGLTLRGNAQSVTCTANITVTSYSTGVSTNTSCMGTVTGNASGGTAPYTYVWNPGGATTTTVSGLCVGCYTLLVTDAKGCSGASSACVSANNNCASLVLGMGGMNATSGCNGLAFATVAGGTGPYTYTWSNGGVSQGITGLCGGCFTVTVTDAKGCTRTGTSCIQAASCNTLQLSTSGINTTSTSVCNGSVTANASGGTAPYTYQWSNGVSTNTATGLCKGCYSVKLTDANGCTRISMVCISLGCNISVSVSGAAPTNGCNGSATANVSGGTAPYTYSWWSGSTGVVASNLCKGCQMVLVSDAKGCTAFDSICFSGSNACNLSATVSSSTTPKNTCFGSASVVVTGGTAPYTYLWNNGASTSTVTGLCAGCYKVKVKDANGCKVSAKVCVIAQFTGNEEQGPGTNNEFQGAAADSHNVISYSVNEIEQVYPNPPRDRMSLVYYSKNETAVLITVRDINGREVLSVEQEAMEGKNEWVTDVTDLRSGTYFITVTYKATGEVRSKMITR